MSKERLIEIARKKGYEPDEVVYSLTVLDILQCIHDAAEQDLEDKKDEEIEEILEGCIDACEYIDWWSPIESAVHQYL